MIGKLAGLSVKQYIVTICVALATCVVMFFVLFNVDSSFNKEFTVSKLVLTQNEDAVEATWKGPHEENFAGMSYEVVVKIGMDSHTISGIEEPEVQLTGLKLGEDTVVKVFAVDSSGSFSRGVSDHIQTKKVKQEIAFDKDSYVGFEGKTVQIGVKGQGDVESASKNEKIATIQKRETKDVNTAGKDGSGHRVSKIDGSVSSSVISLKLKNEGSTNVVVSASGNDIYKPAKAKVKVTAYPDSLDTPQLKVEYISDSRVSLTWDEVEYAKGYELSKYNPAAEKYVKIRDFDADERKIEITRQVGDYALCATTSIGDVTVESDRSEPAKVESTAAKAKTYKSSTNIVNLNTSNLENVATIRGPGNNHVPQSMSFADGNYVITFVNSGGTSASLVAYDRNGKKVSSHDVGNIGHANGTTYNPNTGKYYSVRTHKGTRTPLCTVIDGESYKVTKKFNLPRQASGIAYDESNNKYYVSKGNQVYVMGDNFNMERTIAKKRYNHAQDIGAYNGVALVCTWVSGNTSYIDMYRTSDGAYLGGYNVSIGEIESCIVDDGYLVIDMNTRGSRDEHIYRTKERIAIP